MLRYLHANKENKSAKERHDNWKPRKRSTWKEDTGNCRKFQNPEEVSEQI